MFFFETHCILRQTTRECMHLVARGQFRSREKDGGHIHAILSAIAENPMLRANFTAMCVIEAEPLSLAKI